MYFDINLLFYLIVKYFDTRVHGWNIEWLQSNVQSAVEGVGQNSRLPVVRDTVTRLSFFVNNVTTRSLFNIFRQIHLLNYRKLILTHFAYWYG